MTLHEYYQLFNEKKKWNETEIDYLLHLFIGIEKISFSDYKANDGEEQTICASALPVSIFPSILPL